MPYHDAMAGDSQLGPAPDPGVAAPMPLPRPEPDPLALRMAADAFVGDADALPPLLRRRLSGRGARWGVRLARDAQGLVVAPVGVLDVTSVQRLREIVETRRLLYPRIVVDLRELLAADALGLGALVDWDAEQPWHPVVAALADQRALDALETAGYADVLPLA